MVAQDATVKKRKPPTFRHLPLDRAKKLKKNWVETQKIKSQWKAQKRKEGLVTQRPVPPHMSTTVESHNSEDDKDEDNKDNESIVEDKETVGSDDEASDSEESEENQSEYDKPPSKPVQSSRGRGRGSRQFVGTRRNRDDEEQKEQPSLRELNKQAYSRSSLHTHKSHSLRGTGHYGRGRGGDRGQGTHARGRGRGQPDMRLRMNAMLEKIKRDFA
ncbi:unnamed protein product [Somion occarium]|uniref:rRNA-processing protein FYV7 n=1 Tax=Somion occarium TaxID=3059160 RepID=A0ABP1D9F2_9APHY